MDLDARVALVKEVGEEIVTEPELRALLADKPHPIAYDGFEPSGTAHIAQGVMRAINVNKMTRAGCRFKMFVADWHAWANNKMGGDFDRIQTTGKYLIEIWRATGMDLSKVDFVWASEFIEDEAYWKTVMNVARETSLDRVLRTTQIMGRSEKDKLSAAQILYPCMQAADIFHLQADLTQLGMDQRKVNMLAREVGPRLGFWKPVVVSHHMLMGLQKPQASVGHQTTSLAEIRAPLEGIDIVRRLENRPPILGRPKGAVAEALSKLQSFESWSEVRGVLEDLEGEAKARLRLLGPTDQLQAEIASLEDYTRLEEEEWAWDSVRRQTRLAFDRFIESMGEDERRTVDRATAMKMSKSNPDSAIFMTDTPEQVQAKIKKAYCPEKQAAENPILEYYRYIIFERFPEVKVERPAKFGGDLAFASYAELEQAFVAGQLHPADAKATAARYIDQLLDPVREHFAKNAAARELKQQVEGFQVTR